MDIATQSRSLRPEDELQRKVIQHRRDFSPDLNNIMELTERTEAASKFKAQAGNKERTRTKNCFHLGHNENQNTQSHSPLLLKSHKMNNIRNFPPKIIESAISEGKQRQQLS